MDVEVGRDLELAAGLVIGSVGQLPPDLPNNNLGANKSGKRKRPETKAHGAVFN